MPKEDWTYKVLPGVIEKIYNTVTKPSDELSTSLFIIYINNRLVASILATFFIFKKEEVWKNNQH